MRKNTARKWVHLLLDLLPVLIIPIFAIYLINHNPQGLQLETGGYEVQEKYQTNYVNSDSDLIVDNVYKLLSEDLVNTSYIFGDDNEYMVIKVLTPIILDDSASVGDVVDAYYFNKNIILQIGEYENYFYLRVYSDFEQYLNFDYYVEYLYTGTIYQDFDFQLLEKSATISGFSLFTFSDYQEYEYTYNEGMIYDNTDIGSQFIYSMYIPVRDYFNMTNLFNFGDIYTWINNSMFSGNAPLPIFIVYNVIVYEFLIDLIFLIYSIFMFIIDFSSELLARCFNFSNKGGTR